MLFEKGFSKFKSKIIFLEQNRMIFYEKTQILWNEIEEFRIKWNLFLKIFLVFLVVKYFCTNLQPLIFFKTRIFFHDFNATNWENFLIFHLIITKNPVFFKSNFVHSIFFEFFQKNYPVFLECRRF